MDAACRSDKRVPGIVSVTLTMLDGAWVRLLDGIEHASVARRRLLVAVGLLAPLLVLYRDLLFAGRPWLDLDLLLSYQPRYALLAEGLREGRIPLWADGMLAGFPVAFSEFGWFYPLTWLLLLIFEPLRAYFVELALGMALAAGAAYWLGRVWGLTRLGAYVAAFLFTYGAFIFATSRFLNYVDIFFALPAGVGAIELIARGQRRYGGLLAISAAAMALAGHPQIALLWGFVWLLFACTRLWWIRSDLGIARAVSGLAWIVAATGTGLAIGAVRLLPTVTTTGLSARAGGLDFVTASQGSIPPWSLALGYLYPSFEIPQVLDDSLRAEALLYLGLATPALALVAISAGWRQRMVQFLVGLVVLMWILAMGSFSLGFPLLHKLPLFEFFRQPARFGIAASFGLAFLAAMGTERIRAGELRSSLAVRWVGRAWVWLAGLIGVGTAAATIVLTGFAFLIVPYGYDYIDRAIVGSEGRFLTAERYYRTFDQLYERMTAAFSLEYWAPRWMLLAALLTAIVFWRYLRGRLAPAHAQAALVGVLVLDVLLAPGHAIPTVPEDWYGREPQAASVIPSDSHGEWRVFSYRGLAQKFELSTAAGTQLDRTRRDLLEYVFLQETLTPNLALTGGRASIDGYENLMPRATAEYLAYVGSERTTVPGFASDASLDAAARAELLRLRAPALAAANVRFVTSGVPIDTPTLRQVQAEELELPPWAAVDQTLYVYEVQAWAPRAWIARDWRVVEAEDDTSELLEAIARHPRVPLVDRDPGIRSSASAGSDAVAVLDRAPERVTLRVELADPGLLVLNETIFPGWEATVDGRPTEMLTVNTTMRGVPIDSAGAHTVLMTYRPPGFAAGLAVSLAALGALLVLAATGLWVDRR
ncbi:MAG: YfhO family protein [Chloroflexi bacterium]|nr:YfhO family protein [Chloroflexota bacterium]